MFGRPRPVRPRVPFSPQPSSAALPERTDLRRADAGTGEVGETDLRPYGRELYPRRREIRSSGFASRTSMNPRIFQ